jgi:hypothetical protein
MVLEAPPAPVAELGRSVEADDVGEEDGAARSGSGACVCPSELADLGEDVVPLRPRPRDVDVPGQLDEGAGDVLRG